MKHAFRTTIKAALACLILAGNTAAAGSAAAQSYPTKPIRLIVPFPPGGPPDIVGRMLAQKLTETFKQALVVDNRAGGGGGSVGTETAMRASPDGYTILITGGNHATNPALIKLPYDPVNDVTPISLVGEAALLLTLHPSVPAKSIKELIAYDRANPGKLNYGSSPRQPPSPCHRTLQPHGRHPIDECALQGHGACNERSARRADSAYGFTHARSRSAP
jgi:tripartite-type tricarboxylate transporter receptor subunit TctC